MFFGMTPWVQRLVIMNVSAFFIQMAMPEVAEPLVLYPARVLVQPWTLVTYMFLHGGIGHLFFNMLSLYFFGSRVEGRMGGDNFVRLYFVSGIVGGLLSVVFSPRAGVIGASGAVFGVMFAFAMFWPRQPIYIWGFIPIEARWLVLLTTGFAIFAVQSGSRDGVAHFAHLGGYVGGWLYLWWVDRRSTSREFHKKVRAGPKESVDADLATRIDLSKVHEVNRDEVGRILAKIRESGAGSLTNAERLFLSNFLPQ
jgi:membrane associated rhomboid family serine protease